VKIYLIRRLAVTAAIGLWLASLLQAQSYLGGLRGLIQDPGGAVIVTARVTLTNQTTGVLLPLVRNVTVTLVGILTEV